MLLILHRKAIWSGHDGIKVLHLSGYEDYVNYLILEAFRIMEEEGWWSHKQKIPDRQCQGVKYEKKIYSDALYINIV